MAVSNIPAIYAVPENLTSQLTASEYIESVYNSTCFKVGRVVICNINVNVPSAAPKNATLISGFPIPSGIAYTCGSFGSAGNAVRLRIRNNTAPGDLQLDGTYNDTGYINALLVYTV